MVLNHSRLSIATRLVHKIPAHTTKWITCFDLLFCCFFFFRPADIVPPPPTTAIASSSVEDIDLAALPPPPDFLLETAVEDETTTTAASAAAASLGTKESVTIPERSLSVADAVKTLNEIRHQPASPGVVRRAQSMRATASDSSPMLPGGRGPPPSVLAKTTLGTTPKSREAHHTFTLGKNVSKTAPANHTKTLPKHMPSHPMNPVSLSLVVIQAAAAARQPGTILESINNSLGFFFNATGLSGFWRPEETRFGPAIKVELCPSTER